MEIEGVPGSTTEDTDNEKSKKPEEEKKGKNVQLFPLHL